MSKAKVSLYSRYQSSYYSCKKCFKKFKTKGGLENHTKSHDPEKFLIRCPHCPFTSVQKSNYAKHAAVMHKKSLEGKHIEEKYFCSLCDYKCITELQLKNHTMRKHTPSTKKEFRCQECAYTTVEKAALAKHERIKHTKDKPYNCEVCSLRFSTTSAIARHRRSHTQVKPYQCPHSKCLKTYADRKRLKDHLMTHANERPHKCTFCNYGTNRKDNLNTHIRRNHMDSNKTPTSISTQCSGISNSYSDLSNL